MHGPSGSMRLAPLVLATFALLPRPSPADGSGIDPADIERLLAAGADAAYGEYLAGECAACHARDAEAAARVPRIHGRDAAPIVQALLEYRAGVRENETMRTIAAALGDEEIAALAHYLSTAR